MSEAALSTILEAILFGAGRSMSVEELSELLEKPQGEVQSALRELQATIRRRRDSALQLTDVAGRWIFEVRPTLSPHLPESFRADIPQRLLPAAALVAYHQPMAQSQLVDMLGQRAYDHVRDLALVQDVDDVAPGPGAELRNDARVGDHADARTRRWGFVFEQRTDRIAPARDQRENG